MQVAHAKANAPFFAEWLKDVDPATVKSRAARIAFQFCVKQTSVRCRGIRRWEGCSACPSRKSSTFYVARAHFRDRYRREGLFARRAGHVCGRGFVPAISFTIPFVPPHAGRPHDGGCSAGALGCAVVPGGVGQTELQLDAIEAIRPGSYVGTPSFLKILLEKADDLGRDISSIRKAFVSAERGAATFARQMFRDRGIAAFQELWHGRCGHHRLRSQALEGMIVDEGVLVEIVRPGTGDPVADGEVGEVVVTTFSRAYPLVRFEPVTCPPRCPASALVAAQTCASRVGWGVPTSAQKGRGMFVDPAQIALVARRHRSSARAAGRRLGRPARRHDPGRPSS